LTFNRLLLQHLPVALLSYLPIDSQPMNTLLFKDTSLNAEIDKYARIKNAFQDDVLVSTGDELFFLPIVQKGILRIVRENSDGKKIFLYHLYPGQTCVMTMICSQAGRASMVNAIVEEDAEVLLIPISKIDEWAKFKEWKSFISDTYVTRFTELIQVIDLISFSNMDKQLMHYLEEKSRALNSKSIATTHLEIADELRTHRVAVSRLLRNMEEKGMVRLGRNTIEII
jgi:CRP/FNR family transcriptional regulator, anaerobic regulatory protein